ncbi:MAG: hypothetical protein DWQ34_14715 [Planctomycetota bacterium]|mgnify:CR=1 FL=1|nr:MAG: hypothetical protein DWQ29_09355 [Planctomycetota bacterium]REJ91531.1 MAG: hypothetical protein DWQ34_14715 [Planctomycetota bacterium]REK20536.1 MAG: hypothetical protein DWQ41_24920 [Planctomycetota bacterium]REK28290.1 MAG: hypothetical protein DWQ45_24830 [Planctomycetota bacterium]
MAIRNEEFEERTAPLTSMTGDRKRVRASTAASAEELREFIAGLRGRSPQETLGELSSSSLLRGILQATVGCVVLVAVLTLIPYWMGGTEPQAAASPARAETSSDDAGQPAENATTPPLAAETTGDPDLQRATEAMGLDETRTAAPDENPLDNNLDSLLDGVE